ncbi:MAG TPA: DUF5996 family protein, partial [Phenylobacterium sp.]|nr:DUF5996 family protein [Phenylobacterium sp.]
MSATAHRWPPLPYDEWRETLGALHLWTQIVGKVRVAQTPWLNHSWQAPLYVTARGLSTGVMAAGGHALDLEFDFVAEVLRLRTDAADLALPLAPMSVAAFHDQLMGGLEALGVPVTIHGAPNELPQAIPFAEDHAPRAYDPAQARRFFGAFSQADRVLRLFRT